MAETTVRPPSRRLGTYQAATCQLGIYRRLVVAQVRSQASYRASFALDVLSSAISPMLGLGAIFAMFQVTDSLGGFAATEVLVMFGMAATAFAIAELLAGRVDRLPSYVRTGRLDATLVRPLSVLGQLLALDFAFRRIAQIAVAGAVLLGALGRLHLVWTPARVVLLGLSLAGGAVFFAALFVAAASVTFWWIDSGELANSVTYGGQEFTEYPTNIYSGAFRRVFGFVLGLAFVSYYPTLTLLGRTDPMGGPGWLGWLSPAAALLAGFLAWLSWRAGVRHYRSTGS